MLYGLKNLILLRQEDFSKEDFRIKKALRFISLVLVLVNTDKQDFVREGVRKATRPIQEKDQILYVPAGRSVFMPEKREIRRSSI